jgi:hypothetical protein
MRIFPGLQICTNWDYSPARELTAMYYPLFEYSLLLYLVLDFLVSAISYKKDNNNRDLFYAIALLPHQLPGIVDPRRWHCKQSQTQSQCGRSK